MITEKNGDAVDFVVWLKDQMRQRGWKQAELARRAGISTASICNYFKNRRKRPDTNSLSAIAQALDLPEAIVYRAAGIKLNLETLQEMSPEQIQVVNLMGSMPVALQRVAVSQVSALRVFQEQGAVVTGSAAL